jgi:alcohol dehydrogenase (cytochrome c)
MTRQNIGRKNDRHAGSWEGTMNKYAALAFVSFAALAATASAQDPTPARPFKSIENHDATYQAGQAHKAGLLAKMAPVTDQVLKAPPAGDWLMWRRTYDGQGFSPLSQINSKNASSLQQAWTLAIPAGPNEITPLVHDGVIFIASGGKVQAIDGATGDVLWQYTRPAVQGFNAAGAVVRSIAIYEDKLLVPTPDRHLIALEAKSGKLLWDYEVVPASARGARLSGGPMVAHGKVIQGVSSCNDVKGGCWIVAVDAQTGKEAWRFQTIARPGQPGGDSWNGAPLDERFGAAVWNAGSYDPDLNLVYIGVGQTYDAGTLLQPHASKGESADALYTNSTVALDPDTGKLVWHYQHFARDIWDYDWTFERSLLTLNIGGKPQKVVATAGKLAIYDVVDRKSGQYLYSKDLGLQDLVKSIDPKTGRKTIDPKFEPVANKTVSMCPHGGGAKNWLASSYDASTKMMYVPLVESCMNFTWKARSPAETAAGGSDLDWELKMRPDTDGNIGRIEAINLETGKVAWTKRRRAPPASSALATAGGVLFEGSRDRWFRASDSATGKVLWSTRLTATPSSTPVTYTVGGQEYVAVVSGGGGPHDITWAALNPEMDSPAGGTTLWVFKVPKAAGKK